MGMAVNDKVHTILLKKRGPVFTNPGFTNPLIRRSGPRISTYMTGNNNTITNSSYGIRTLNSRYLIMKNNTFSHLLSCYLTKYLPGIAGLSSNTIMSYRDMFKNLVVFYETKLNIKPEKICIDNFNSGNIISFLKWLESDRGNSVSTRNVRLASIHAFARYVERHLPESINIMQNVLSIPYKKCPYSPPVFINADATKLLLAMPDVNTTNGRRDRVLLSLLYDSGARVQELCDLKVSDIRLDEPCTVKLTGKGGKTRIVPITKPMAGLLRQYIKEQDLCYPNCNCNSLFKNRSRCKFTRKGIYCLFG